MELEKNTIFKIIVTGSPKAGKTQFISSAGSLGASDQGVQTLSLSAGHTGIDFGEIRITPHAIIHLYGFSNPGILASFWKMLLGNCIGYILLVDSSVSGNLEESLLLLESLKIYFDGPMVVAVTKPDLPGTLSLDFIREKLNLDPSIPLIKCVASDRESVKEVILTLLEMVYEVTV